MKYAWLAFVLSVLGQAWAHGGTYPPPPRIPPGSPYAGPSFPGPKDTPGSGAGPSPSSGGPARPAGTPAAPVPAATPLPRSPFPLPMTSAADEIPEPALWQVWWSYNHDAFLDALPLAPAARLGRSRPARSWSLRSTRWTPS